jgi:hypothetical protein
MRQTLALGARVIGVHRDEVPVAQGEDSFSTFTEKDETFQALTEVLEDEQGQAKDQWIEYCRFCSVQVGRPCLDIDRGHEGQPDGLLEFYSLWQPAGRSPQPLLSPLRDIGRGSFPVSSSTPWGGFHLFFNYPGPDIRK